jgi:ubiquinol-cytochrome c reductase cytochrome c1 subunit
MVRLGAFLIGLFMAGWLLVSAGVTTYEMITEPAEETLEAKYHLHPDKVKFAHDGPFGKFDNQQLQRGFKVYQEVCSSCHSLNQVAFRNLEDIGYSEAEVKAIAKAATVPGTNTDTGEAATRPGLPIDKFPSPYLNEIAARAANNNAYPPDLSLITKARHNGPAYVYSLLTGYDRKMPKGVEAQKGLHYNPYFPTLHLAMTAPITSDGQVTFDDMKPGQKATKKQMAKDVAAFLTWTAEPKMNQRKTVGWAALIFLLIFTGLTYLSYRQVWADKKH